MEDRSGQVLAINVAFFSLTWIIMMARVYTRAYLIKSFGADDWTMLAALLLLTGYLICQLGGVTYGTGRYDKDLAPEDRMRALRYWWFCELFYTSATCMLKCSVGLFLLRIAVKRAHILTIHIMNGATILLSVAYFFVFIFQCNPVSSFWTIKPNNEHCLPIEAIAGISYGAAALGSVSDWTFGVLPGFIVWDLQMNKRTKLVVVGILAFAAIGSTATIIRMPYIKGFEATHDFLYESTDIAIWSTIEPGIGMTAACIATLRPLLQHVLHRTGLSTPDKRTNYGSYGNQLGSKSRRTGGGNGYIRSNSYSHAMDTLRPDTITGTATVVTGGSSTNKNWRDDSDKGSDEHIITHHSISDIHISKSVQVTHVSEPAEPSPVPYGQHPSYSHQHQQSRHGRQVSRIEERSIGGTPRSSDDSLV
ncbi:Integral membrane protein [Neofusicoccum parvum]|nr:Integral membrane protein [Neofusicoccum parvum]